MIFISQPVLKGLFLTLSVCLYDLWDLDCFWGFLRALFQMTVMLSGVAGETKVFAQKKWQVRREIIFWSFFFVCVFITLQSKYIDLRCGFGIINIW